MRRSVSPGFGAAALAERAIRLTRLRRPASLRPRFCSHDADLKRIRSLAWGWTGPREPATGSCTGGANECWRSSSAFS